MSPALTTRLCSWPSSCVSAPKTWPVPRTSSETCSAWPSSTVSRSLPSSAKAGRLPSASLRSRPRPATALERSCCQRLEALARLRIERLEDLVELHRLGHARVAEEAAVGHRARRALVTRRHLDVGLAQQRLLAQDGAGVLGDRRVLAVELEGGHGAVGMRGVDRLVAHLAHADAGHPHVGLQAELRGLREGDLDLVALGLERDRAAEAEPQEEQQAEARQGEEHHGGDAGRAMGPASALSWSRRSWGRGARATAPGLSGGFCS